MHSFGRGCFENFQFYSKYLKRKNERASALLTVKHSNGYD